MRDRIADEHHLGIEPIFDPQHLRMPGIPIVAVLLQLRHRNQGGITRMLLTRRRSGKIGVSQFR